MCSAPESCSRFAYHNFGDWTRPEPGHRYQDIRHYSGFRKYQQQSIKLFLDPAFLCNFQKIETARHYFQHSHEDAVDGAGGDGQVMEK